MIHLGAIKFGAACEQLKARAVHNKWHSASGKRQLVIRDEPHRAFNEQRVCKNGLPPVVNAEMHDDAQTLSLTFEVTAYFDSLTDFEIRDWLEERHRKNCQSDAVAYHMQPLNSRVAGFFALKPAKQRNGDTNGFECSVDFRSLEEYASARAITS